MGKFTSKGKHTVKVGNHPQANMILKPAIMRRAQIQDVGNAFEETSNLKKSFIYTHIYMCIYIYIYEYIYIAK